MSVYKKMYYSLAADVADITDKLIAVQQRMENMYVLFKEEEDMIKARKARTKNTHKKK